MVSYAFIFARGGSKGLPKKNCKLLSGKPLIQYSIEVALASKYIQQIFVSTDDADIAVIAKKFNVQVIDRPKDLATDTSPEWLSWQHGINWVKKNVGEFDQFVSLPTTSPLRSVEDVNGAIEKRISSNADVCIAITPSSRSPYFNMVQHNTDGTIGLVISPKESVYRRQDAPAVFDITTSVYATTPNYILNHNGLFDGSVTSIEVPKERSIDIDDIYDFMLAQSILEVVDVK
ncbi:cytidylyltransferase domain-containing protein [Bermanella sp. WJH001]|uniref:acylneuraminate cytidylyltransferase family protein n=1 Tax=Bermanella sp. WJH001 TaxID=3048005 RepID=UPI0024BF0059|nr:acylneuraminate cytidylyltransferase family protein [Bermanella sp. WJH001]MDJ1537760.1 acylneuraminate cytidylyltransferase family protein [Bermanella sp. WJH001]